MIQGRFFKNLSLVLIFIISFIGSVRAANHVIDGSIKLYFETKKITKADIDALVASGSPYVDLWLYAEFSESLRSEIDRMIMNAGACGYVITDESGVIVNTPSSVFIPGGRDCPANAKQPSAISMGGAANVTWQNSCPVYAWTTSWNANGPISNNVDSENGLKIKMFKVRFKVLTNDGFYIKVIRGAEGGATGATGNFAMNINGGDDGTLCEWKIEGGSQTGQTDLSKDHSKFIIGDLGGLVVEKNVITGFRTEKSPFCPGEDIELKASFSLPSGANFSDYTITVETPGGTALSIKSPVFNSTAQTAQITIPSAAYDAIMDPITGKAKLLLRAAIGSTSDVSTTIEVSRSILPALYNNVSLGKIYNTGLSITRVDGVGGALDTVKEVDEYKTVYIRLDDAIHMSPSIPTFASFFPNTSSGDATAVLNVYSDASGSFAAMSKGPAPGSSVVQTQITLPNNPARYYTTVLWASGCVTNTDTIVIAPKKTYPAPTLSIAEVFCGAGAGTVNISSAAPIGMDVTNWRWVIRQEICSGGDLWLGQSCLIDGNDPLTVPTQGNAAPLFSGGFIMTSGETRNVTAPDNNNYVLSVPAAANSSSFNISGGTVNTGNVGNWNMPNSLYGFWMDKPDEVLKATVDCSYKYFQGIKKHIYVQYQTADNVWSQWAVAATPNATTPTTTQGFNNTAVHGANARFDISSDHNKVNPGLKFNTYCSNAKLADTTVVLGNSIPLYFVTTVAVEKKMAVDLLWQCSQDGGATWFTWAITPANSDYTGKAFNCEGIGTNMYNYIEAPGSNRIIAMEEKHRIIYNANCHAVGDTSSVITIRRKSNIVAGSVTARVDGNIILSDSVICVGSTLALNISGQEAGATLSWESSSDGIAWTKTGNTSNSITYTPLASDFIDIGTFANGIKKYYRVKLIVGNDSTTTTEFKISAHYVEPPVIDVTPTKSTISGLCAGDKYVANFSVARPWYAERTFEVSMDGTTYSKNGGAVESQVTINTSYNYTQATVSAMNGMYMRMKTQYKSCVAYSAVERLRVVAPPVAGSITPDTLCKDQNNLFTYVGDGTSFEWYYKDQTNSSVVDKLIPNETGSTLTAKVPTPNSKLVYEGIGVRPISIYGTLPDTTVCAASALVAKPYLYNYAAGSGYIMECEIQLLADKTEICALSSDITLTLGTAQAIVSVEYSTDGTNYTAVNPSDYTATDILTDGKIIIKASFFKNTGITALDYAFRVNLISLVPTTIAKVKVNPNPTITINKTVQSNSPVCMGNDLTIDVETATAVGASDIYYAWHKGEKTSADIKLTDDGDYSGTSSTTLNIENPVGSTHNNEYYYCQILARNSTTTCYVGDTTTPIQIKVNPKPDTTGYVSSASTITTACASNAFSLEVKTSAPQATTKNTTLSYKWYKGTTQIVSGTTITGLTIEDLATNEGSTLKFDASAATNANDGSYSVEIKVTDNATSCDSIIKRSFNVSFTTCSADEVKDDDANVYDKTNPFVFCENEILAPIKIVGGTSTATVNNITLYVASAKTGPYTAVVNQSNPVASSISYTPVAPYVAAGSYYYYAKVSRKDLSPTYTDTVEYFIGAKSNATVSATIADISACPGIDTAFEIKSLALSGTDATNTKIGSRLWYKTPATTTYIASKTDNKYEFTNLVAANSGTYGAKIVDSIVRNPITNVAINKACYDTLSVAQADLVVFDAPELPSVSISNNSPICEDEQIELTAALTPATIADNTFTYQWYKGTDTIKSATNLTYTKSNSVTADAGSYGFKVFTETKNGCIDSTSATNTTVTINALPTFNITEPTDVTVCSGLDATFSVTANITNPATADVSFQWQKADGSNISSGAEYTINNASASSVSTATSTLVVNAPAFAKNGEEYKCVITVADASCSKDSTSATVKLTVKNRPSDAVIETQPVGYTGCSGKSWSLSVETKPTSDFSAVPISGYTFEWYNGTTLIASSNADYSIKNTATKSEITGISGSAIDNGSKDYNVLIIINPTDATNICPDSVWSNEVTVNLVNCPSEDISDGYGGGSGGAGSTYDKLNPLTTCDNLALPSFTIEPASIAGFNVSNVEIYYSTTINGTYSLASTLNSGPYTFTPSSASAGSHYYYAKINRSGFVSTTTDTIEYFVGQKPAPTWNIVLDNASACEGSDYDFTATVSTSVGAVTLGNRLWYKDPAGANTLKATRSDNKLPFLALALADDDTYGLKVVASAERTTATVATSKVVCYDTSAVTTAELTVNRKAAAPTVSFTNTTETICEGTDITIAPTVAPDPAQYLNGSPNTDADISYSYTWYRKPVSGVEAVISGETNKDLKLTSLTNAANHGDKYKVKVVAQTVNSCNDSATSAEFTLEVLASPGIKDKSIAADPTNATVCHNESIEITATATIDNMPTSGTSSWQWKRVRGGTTTAISNGDESGKYVVTKPSAVFGTGLASKLEITKTDNAVDNGDVFYCVIEANNGTCDYKDSTSNLSITVNALPSKATITTDVPASKNICQNSDDNISATVSNAAAGTAHTYNWYSSASNTGPFSTLVATTATPVLDFKETPSTNEVSSSTLGTIYYRLEIKVTDNTTSCSDTTWSQVSKVVIASCGADSVFSDNTYTNSKESAICQGSTPSDIVLRIAAQEVPSTITWQVSYDGSATVPGAWSNVAVGSAATDDGTTSCSVGSTSSCTFTPNADKIKNTSNTAVKYIYYRAVVTRANFPSITTNAFRYMVNPKPSAPVFSADPATASYCKNTDIDLSGTATAAQGTLSYFWQHANTTADVFANISGATSNSYNIASFAVADSGRYQLAAIATNTYGCKDTTFSAVANISMNPAPVFNTPIAVDATICETKDTAIKVTIAPIADATTRVHTWVKPDGSVVTTTDPALAFKSAKKTDAGSYIYRTVGTTDLGCKDSSADVTVQLTVNSIPYITWSDKDLAQSVGSTGLTTLEKCEGESVTITYKEKPVVVPGHLSLSYRWYKDDVALDNSMTGISDATEKNLTISNLDATLHNGSYTLKVTANDGTCDSTIISNALVITVNEKPDVSNIIATDLKGLYNLCPSDSVTLSVTAETPDADFSYKFNWYKGTTFVESNTTGTLKVLASSIGAGLSATYSVQFVKTNDITSCVDSAVSTSCLISVLASCSESSSLVAGGAYNTGGSDVAANTAETIAICASSTDIGQGFVVAPQARPNDTVMSVKWYYREAGASTNGILAKQCDVGQATDPWTFVSSCTFNPSTEAPSYVLPTAFNGNGIELWAEVERKNANKVSTPTYKYIINANPVASSNLAISPADTTICEGKKADLTASSTGNTFDPSSTNNRERYEWFSLNDASKRMVANTAVFNAPSSYVASAPAEDSLKTRLICIADYVYAHRTLTCSDTSDFVKSKVIIDKAPFGGIISDANSNPAASYCISDVANKTLTLSAYTPATSTISYWEIDTVSTFSGTASVRAQIPSSSGVTSITANISTSDFLYKPKGSELSKKNYIRAWVKNGCCDSVASASYVFTIDTTPVLGTVKPTDTSICTGGSPIDMVLDGSNLASTLTWELSGANNTTYAAVGTPSTTGTLANYSFSKGASAVTDTGWYSFRVKAENGSTCAAVYSNVAKVYVALSINPSNYNVKYVRENTTDTVTQICIDGNILLTIDKKLPTGTAISRWEWRADYNDGTSASTTVLAQQTGAAAANLPYIIDESFFTKDGDYYFTPYLKTGNCTEVPLSPQRLRVFNQPKTPVLSFNSPLCYPYITGNTITSGLSTVLVAGQTIKWDKTVDSIVSKGANFEGSNLEANFAPSNPVDIVVNASWAPKANIDTVYFVRATNAMPAAVKGCKTASDTVRVVVKIAPVNPTLVADPNPACGGSEFTVTATGYKGVTVWKQTITKAGVDTDSDVSSSTVVAADKTDLTILAADNDASSYKFVVKDSISGCSSTLSNAITVNVRPAAEIGSIKANDSAICATGSTSIKASGVKPANASVTFELSQDTTVGSTTIDNSQTITASASNANYTFVPYNNAGDYFIRYIVDNGSTDCANDTTHWVKVQAFAAASFAYDANMSGQNICDGDELTLSYTYSNIDSLYIYSSSANITAANTSLLDTVVAVDKTLTAGTINIKPDYTPKTYYRFVGRNTLMSTASICAVAENSGFTNIDVNVDAKPVGGDLVLTTPSPDPVAEVGSSVALQLNGASGTYELESVSNKTGAVVNYGDFASIAGATASPFSVTLVPAHQDTTHFRVKVSSTNNSCPVAYSDTVWVYVKSSAKAQIVAKKDGGSTAVSNFCQSEDAILEVSGDPTVLSYIDKCSIQWERKHSAGSWEVISSPAYVDAADASCSHKFKIKEDLSALTDAGSYSYRITYTHDNTTAGNTDKDTSALGSISIDELSHAGGIVAVPNTLCEGNGQSKVGLANITDYKGSITGIIHSKDDKAPWAVKSPISTTNLSEIFIAHATMPDSGYYRLIVKNGVCAADTSSSSLLKVFHKVKASSVLVNPNPVCYDGTISFSTSGYSGTIQDWLYSNDTTVAWKSALADGLVSKPIPDNFSIADVKDGYFAKVIVGGDACSNDTSAATFAPVFDTIEITTQPIDKSVVLSGTPTADFTVVASAAGLTYSMSSDAFAVPPTFSYQWEYSDDNGANYTTFSSNGNLNADKYTGAKSATITLAYDYFKDNFSRVYRCVVSNTCNTIYSDTAKVVGQAALDPGIIAASTVSGCFYYGDSVLFVAKNYAGGNSIDLHWYFAKNYATTLPAYTDTIKITSYIAANPGASLVVKGVSKDSALIIAPSAWWKALETAGYDHIRTFITDENNAAIVGTRSAGKTLCFGEKPQWIVSSDTVCSGVTSTDIKISYKNAPSNFSLSTPVWSIKRPSDADFTNLTNGGSFSNATFTFNGNGLDIQSPDATLDSAVIRSVVQSNYSAKPDTILYAVLRIDQPVGIKFISPEYDTVCEGKSIELIAVLDRKSSIPGKVSWEWKGLKDGSTVDHGTPNRGETTKDTIYGRTSAANIAIDSGMWILRAGNACNGLISVPGAFAEDTAFVTVNIIPTIGKQPVPDTTCSGGDIAFNATWTKIDDKAIVQWQFSEDKTTWVDLADVPGYISGADKVSPLGLTINDATTADAGFYRIKISTTSACSSSGSPWYSDIVEAVIDTTPLLSITPNPSLTVKVFTSNPGFTVSVSNPSSGVSGTTYPKYEWSILTPQKATADGEFEKLADYIASNLDYKDSISANGNQMQILKAPLSLDSTFFVCNVENSCGVSISDTVLLRVNDKFSIQEIIGDTVCEGDSAWIKIKANTIAEDVIYRIGKPDADGVNYTWSSFSVPNADIDSIAKEDNGSYLYALFIESTPYSFNNYKFAAIFNENVVGEDVVYSDTVSLVVNKVVQFTCANPDNEAIDKSKSLLLIGSTNDGTSVLSYNTSCALDPVDNGSYTYSFALKGPKDAEYAEMLNSTKDDITVAYTASTDTGIHNFYLSVSNMCGGDTAYTTIRVIEKITGDKIYSWIDTANNPTPNAPQEAAKDNDKPWNDPANETQNTACENSFLKLVVPIGSGIVKSFSWEASADGGSTWSDATVLVNQAQVLAPDTLLVDPVLYDIDGYKFRLVRRSDIAEANDTSVVYLLNVTPVNGIKVNVTATPNPARDGDNVDLVAEVTLNDVQYIPASGQYKWSAIDKDGTVSDLGTTNSNVYDLDGVTVVDHDSTQYFCEFIGSCSTVASDTALLRLYSTLVVDWTSSETMPEGTLVDTVKNPPLNTIVTIFDDINEETSTRAYYFSCANTEPFVIYLPAEVVKGIVDADECRWEYSSDTGKTWNFVSTNTEWAEVVPGSMALNIYQASSELNGYLIRFTGRADVDQDGNAQFEDVTSVLELRISKPIVEGSLSMDGCSDEVFCNEHSYDFSITPADPSYKYQWFVDNQDGNGFVSVGGDSSRYIHGNATFADSGKVVKAVVSNLCGSDTVDCVIKIKEPLEVEVSLNAVDVCFGEEPIVTAIPVNGGDDPIYEWSVNGQFVVRTPVSSYSLSGKPAGEYKVGVRMVSSLDCVKDSIARDSIIVVIHPTPVVEVKASTVEAVVGDSVLLTATVTIEEGTDYDLLWTPSDMVKNPTSDETYTVVFEENGEYKFVATVTTEFGCEAKDTVTITVKNNFIIDSIPTVVMIPPLMDGLEADTTINMTFIGNTVNITVCENSHVYMKVFTSGGIPELKYNWNDVDVIYPQDYSSPYISQDSVFGFFLDGSRRYFNCDIEDGSGARVRLHVFVEFYTPSNVVIEAAPKMKLTKYFTNQGVYYTAHPNHFDKFSFYKVINDVLVDKQSSEKNTYKTHFKHETDQDNWVYVEIKDKNGCHAHDSIQVGLLPLPNTMICDDPLYPDAGIIFPEFEVEVYNSWGQIVKRMGDGLGWDATKGNKKIESGTYYYKVKIPTLDGFTYINGAVTVFRKK